MTEKTSGDYLEDIIDSINAAIRFIGNMSYDEFVNDQKTVYATIRAIQIIGEAAKKIPDYIRVKYPHIPWREITGMRDKITHEYFGVQLNILWNTVKEDLPPLKGEMQNILKYVDEIEG